MSTRVRVLTTGGTIASTGTDDGAKPEKSGAELVDAVPVIEEFADISVEEVAQKPSFDMDLETLATLAESTIETAADGVDGIVITHGTDTMEESAYFLNRTAAVDAPIVFTGAQRRPDEISSDGPANLATAVRAAAHDRFQEHGGTYIAFDETVHTAHTGTKLHTSKLDTFQSPDSGPVASETRGGFRFHRQLGGQPAKFDPIAPEVDVRIVSSAAGVGRAPIDEAINGGVDGIVVNGTGLGNTTAPLGNAIADAIDSGVSVVVCSRCPGGETRAVYGGDGGAETLRKHGVSFAGDLPAQKARLELALALDQSRDPRQHFQSM